MSFTHCDDSASLPQIMQCKQIHMLQNSMISMLYNQYHLSRQISSLKSWISIVVVNGISRNLWYKPHRLQLLQFIQCFDQARLFYDSITVDRSPDLLLS